MLVGLYFDAGKVFILKWCNSYTERFNRLKRVLIAGWLIAYKSKKTIAAAFNNALAMAKFSLSANNSFEMNEMNFK